MKFEIVATIALIAYANALPVIEESDRHTPAIRSEIFQAIEVSNSYEINH